MKWVLFTTALLLTGNAVAQFSSERQLLVFKNEATSQQVQEQMNLLDQSAPGVKERALKIILVDHNSPLVSKYRVDTAQFTVILIGKDGGEKYRGKEIIKSDKLFSIIDGMPMRKSEMRKSK